MPTSFTDDLRLAHVLADDADSLTHRRFQALDLRVVTKPDLTPVTDADRAVEEGIRRTLSRARPRDAVLGEETGTTGHSQRRWVVDPIDGTKNFVRGVPVWATLISLMVDDEVVVGVVSAPHAEPPLVGDEGRRRLHRPLAAQGDPDPRLRRLPARGRLALLLLARRLGRRGRLDDFLTLSRRCWRTRAYGDFWTHMLVAEGAVDFAAEPELELYDMAALDVIVREAGGRFTSLDGTPGPMGGNALASNGMLHETVLGFLGSVRGATTPTAPADPGGAPSTRRRPEPAGDEPPGPTGGPSAAGDHPRTRSPPRPRRGTPPTKPGPSPDRRHAAPAQRPRLVAAPSGRGKTLRRLEPPDLTGGLELRRAGGPRPLDVASCDAVDALRRQLDGLGQAQYFQQVRRQQQPGQVEPAVAAGGARRRVADADQPVGSSTARSRSPARCRAPPARSRRRPRRRTPRATVPTAGSRRGRGTRRRRARRAGRAQRQRRPGAQRRRRPRGRVAVRWRRTPRGVPEGVGRQVDQPVAGRDVGRDVVEAVERRPRARG